MVSLCIPKTTEAFACRVGTVPGKPRLSLSRRSAVVIDDEKNFAIAKNQLYKGVLFNWRRDWKQVVQTPVVIKIAADPLFVDELKREVGILHALAGRPGFSALLYVGSVDLFDGRNEEGKNNWTAPFLIMPFVPGYDADQFSLEYVWLHSAPFVARARAVTDNILAPIADRLAILHEMGIVHRDVKSNNVLVNASSSTKIENAVVTLLDFGHARKLSEPQRDDLGAIGYYPPELEFGFAAVDDLKVDVYGLGITSFVLLTGQKGILTDEMEDIFGEMAFLIQFLVGDKCIRRYYEQLLALKHLSPEQLIARSNMPAPLKRTELGKYLGKLCHPNPARRPSNMQQIAEKLRKYAGMLGESEGQ
ncbi:MAG: protein kinase [Candidatus Margulisiibacteriota bacterium]